MRAISYSAILTHVYSLLNLVAADVTAADKTKLNAFIQRRAREAFQFYWWPETMRMEERFYRQTYSASTSYTASTASTSTEVFYPATRTYYQCLRDSTGNAPATLSSGSYTTNLGYWATVGENYGGNDWAASTAYAQGDVVRNPSDGLYYQCHTAHTSSSSFDTTKFGLLTEWLPYISLDQSGKTAIGQVRGCFLENPARTRDPRRVTMVLGPSGLHLPEVKTTSVVVWFQTKPPVLTGADYSAGTAYSAGTIVYYSSATAGYEGDYWLCATATSAGQNPETHAAKWTRQEIPESLRDAIAHAAYGDYLRPAAKPGEIPIEDTQGGAFLAAEMRKLTAMQRQAGKWSFA
jgi:hypothetical protein